MSLVPYRLPLVSCLVLASAIDGIAQDPPQVTARDFVQRMDEASQVKRGSYGKKGQERTDILMQAATAYDAIAKDFAAEKAGCQEATFRAAEIHRSLGRVADAVQRFERCVELAATKGYTARAMLELGHLNRRRSEFQAAMAWYERVGTEFAALLPYRDDAFLWIGKLLSQRGDHGGARERWNIVAAEGEGDTDRIQAYDLIAMSYLEEGNRAKAEETVGACHKAFEAKAASPTRDGQKIARALQRMRSYKELNG
ncbi:MAG: tetratricopeptide repeat protein [Planctomycetes bacterium]|nr:tetratricopeptide repeat protein [Planctomycetota bacterium]